MSKDSKSFLRWIGEAALVFGSVVGAFYFEDLREDRREKEEYVNILLNFRNDIHDDVYDFRVQVDKEVASNCWVCNDTTTLGIIDRHLRYGIGKRDTVNRLMYRMMAMNYDRWRFPSPYYNEINKYSSLLEKDSLRTSISTYNEVFISEFLVYEGLNNNTERCLDLGFKLFDFTKAGEIDRLIDVVELRNVLLAKYMQAKAAIRLDLHNAERLTDIVNKIDVQLAKHSIDTASLDKKWLLKLNPTE